MSEVQSTDNPTLEKLIREVDYVKMGENYIPSMSLLNPYQPNQQFHTLG